MYIYKLSITVLHETRLITKQKTLKIYIIFKIQKPSSFSSNQHAGCQSPVIYSYAKQKITPCTTSCVHTSILIKAVPEQSGKVK